MPLSEDPFALPDEITEEYVQRVLDELMRIRADAVRAALALDPYPEEPGDLPVTVWLRLEEAYTSEQVAVEATAVHTRAAPEFRQHLANPYTGERFLVSTLRRIESACVAVDVTVDIGGAFADPSTEQTSFLVALAPEADGPTPLQIGAVGSPDTDVSALMESAQC